MRSPPTLADVADDLGRFFEPIGGPAGVQRLVELMHVGQRVATGCAD